MQQAGGLIDGLRKLPALNDDELITDLKSTFAAFKRDAMAVITHVDVLEWHYNHGQTKVNARNNGPFKSPSEKPEVSREAWWKAVRILVLLQPSSAAAERVFSILQRHVGAQQYNMLGDAIRVGLMLEYNKRVV